MRRRHIHEHIGAISVVRNRGTHHGRFAKHMFNSVVTIFESVGQMEPDSHRYCCYGWRKLVKLPLQQRRSDTAKPRQLCSALLGEESWVNNTQWNDKAGASITCSVKEPEDV